MRLAAIDLGTNTVRLLVTEADRTAAWRVIDQDQRVTRLGEGLRTSGTLGDQAMARTTTAVVEYVERAARAGATDVLVCATSAVRDADNGAAFVQMLERRTGRPVRVVSGDEEARLTLRGVLYGLPPIAGPLIVFDIGGGSTEFILAEGGALSLAVSLRLGVVSLAERFPFPATVDRDRYAELTNEVRAHLATGLPPAVRQRRADLLVGTAGTVTTLAALDLGLRAYDSRRVQGHRLSRRAIEALGERLGALSMAERAALPCLEPGRADLIIPGLAIVEATLECVGVETLIVSDYGFREGIIVEALGARR